MLKLMIADDERVIRETISSLIDWESLGIEVIGLCKDGIEAYNMILDETPDIVMTDIRMPGLSGLELVREITQTDRQIQFIILSGYEEFDYAREAMKYGVKHYLLKPCSAGKLIESIEQASEDSRKVKKQMEERLKQNAMMRIIHQDAIYHLITVGIAMEEFDSEGFSRKLQELTKLYGGYQDFDRDFCYLYYIYFLEWEYLEECLERLEAYGGREEVTSVFYGIYVKNTLLLFSYRQLAEEQLKACMVGENSIIETAWEDCDGLSELLKRALERVRRYDMIYAIHNFRAIAILNNRNAIRYMQDVYHRLESAETDVIEECFEQLLSMVNSVSQPEFLQMLGNGICTQMSAMGAYSMSGAMRYFRNASGEKDIEKLRELTRDMLSKAQEELKSSNRSYGILTERIMDYVDKNLSDHNLTLKKIAEQYLYMNVDYVSRQFHRDTGMKFSQYLTEQRVKRAKELLLAEDSSKIQYVAERVGCGNNPQYFSQIFKKMVGMTPGKWASQAKS